jgi:hypothetical protein
MKVRLTMNYVKYIIALIVFLSINAQSQYPPYNFPLTNPGEVLHSASIGVDTSNIDTVINLLETSNHYEASYAALFLALRGRADLIPTIKTRYYEAISEDLNSFDYLTALYLLNDPSVHQMVRAFIDTMMIYKEQSRGYYDYLNVTKAIMMLLNLGDYSTFNILNSLLDYQGEALGDADVQLLLPFAMRDEYRSTVYRRLIGLLKSPSRDYRVSTLLALDHFLDSADTKLALEDVALNDNDDFARHLASSNLIHFYHDDKIISISRHRAIIASDTTSLYDAIMNLEDYPSPRAFNALYQVRDSLPEGDFEDIVSNTIERYRCPFLPDSEAIMVSIDSITSAKHQTHDLSWLTNQSFVNELDSNLTSARNYIVAGDSNNCARQIKIFQQKVDEEYRDSLDGDNRTVTIEGWKFLYYNAQYILDRLPTPPAQYKLNINTIGNGTITPSPEYTLYDSATTVTLTATAGTGYKFSGWSGDVNDTTNPLAIIMNNEKTITGTFIQDVFTITATAEANGTIAPSGDVSVTYGNNQRFTFTPSTGYHTDSVLADGVNKPDSTSGYTFLNVSANHTIRVTYRINTYTITSTAGSNGSINPSGTTTVNYGGSQMYTITPNSCYHVDSVLVDGTNQGAITTYTFTNVTANHTIRSVYAITQYTITSTAGSDGTVSPSGTTTINCSGSQTYTLTPAAHYHVDSLIVDGSYAENTTSYYFTTVTANHTIRAVFAIDTYTLTTSVSGQGEVIPTPNQTLYGYGTSVTLRARWTDQQAQSVTKEKTKTVSQEAPTSWRFDHWTGDASGSTNPLTISMTANKTIQAVFVPVY